MATKNLRAGNYLDISHMKDGSNIANHLPMVVFMLNRYFKKYLGENSAEWEEAFSEGCIGLWRGLDTYNGSVKLSYYLSVCIKNQIYLYIRKREKYNKIMNQTDVAVYEGKNLNSVLDIKTKVKEDEGLTDFEFNLIKSMKNISNPRYKAVVDGILKGKSLLNISQELGITKSAVNHVINQLRHLASFVPKEI